MNNADIAHHFSLLSKLMDIHGENSFKSKTYSIAAFQIEKLPEALATTERERIKQIRGMGPSVAAKIFELLDTGHINSLTELLENTPAGVMELLQLKGLGPKKINIIWKEMGIQSIGELEYACHENRLTRFKGFGEKTQDNVLKSITFYTQHAGHFLYAQAETVYPAVKNYLENLFGKDKVLPTGAFRRQALTISELEFVIDETKNNIKPKFLTAYPPELLEETHSSLLYKLNNGLRLKLYTGDNNIVRKQFLSSASTEFADSFMSRWPALLTEDNKWKKEQDIFDAAGIPYILPCLRENERIIERAAQDKLPEVIQPHHIKGVIHNHSNWSDGVHTIEEMASFLAGKNYEYLVISDHSKSAAYANGLSEERIIEQQRYINSLNEKLSPFKIFKSIECDILNDGSLDYADEVLAGFDLVIASVHSSLFMNEAKAMQRVIKAIENPYTTILGHPTGRLLLSREGYPIDHISIIDACAANKVVIEINANPRRLDLDWRWIEYAMERGVLLSINPDAHSIEGFGDMKYGVLAAQKGGLTAPNNLSSFSLSDFEKYISDLKIFKGITRGPVAN